MCGRTTLTITPGDLERTFGFPVPADYRAGYNIAPTQTVLALSESRGQRGFRGYRWGLVPHWAKDPSVGSRMINARVETLSTRAAFRDLIGRRRCLVVVDGYYEWQATPEGKRPHRVVSRSGGAFTLAGLWDRWNGGDEVIESCSIITREAAPHLAWLHDRMPLVISPGERDAWLSRDTELRAVPGLLSGEPDDDLHAYEVSTLVNRPENDGPECIEPLGDRREVAHAPSRRTKIDRSENYSLFSESTERGDGRT